MKKKNAGARMVCALLAVIMILTASSCSSTSADGSVIYGKNNFLFAASGENYDYLADYLGELSYTDDELKDISAAMTKRTLAYSNGSAGLYFVFVPNAQTVYSDLMPSSVGKKGESSLLTQLTAYLAENTDLNFIDLTQVYLAAKENSAPLYDNTDNTINAYGAYYALKTIVETLKTDGIGKKNAVDDTMLEQISCTKTAGLSLAQACGSNIENESYTLSILDDSAKYTVSGGENTFYSTYVKLGSKNEVPTNPSLLIQYGKQSDYSVLLPWFSSTYGGMGYISGYGYNSNVMNSIAPKAVLQFIYEDELYTLADDAVNTTYNIALKPGDDPTVSSTPIVLGVTSTDDDTVCISGTVEDGAVITVSGDGIDTFEAEAMAGRFFIPVNLPGGGSMRVTMTAKVADKDESSPLELTVTANVSATVFAGKNSQLHYPDTLADYYCTNLFSEDNLAKTETRLMKKLDKIREASGKNTKLVFLIPPDCITAYPETATDEMIAQRVSEYSRLQQIEDYFKDNEDIIIINLTNTMLENKSLGRLYYQTDTHWTTLGAYLGYYELMSVIAEDFPAAAPRELSEYNVYQQWDAGGDLVSFLGLDQGAVNEFKTICTPAFTNRAVITEYFSGSSSYSYSDELLCKVDMDGLPNAIMICDSFGANLFDFVSDAFGTLVRQTMWTYTTDLDLCAAIEPDYYIQVMVERNMANLYVN